MLEEEEEEHEEEEEDQQKKKQHKWEGEYLHAWKGIEESKEERENAELRRRLAKRESRNKRAKAEETSEGSSLVKRGLSRHVVVVADISLAGEQVDYRPCRGESMIQNLSLFVSTFFQENPISQLSVVVAHNSVAEKLTELSGNAAKHTAALPPS